MNASVDWMARGRPTAAVRPRRRIPAARSSLTAAETSNWEDQVIDRLFDLLQFSEDWDSYGAKAPLRTSADAVFAVLTSIMGRTTPTPSIVPSSQGHFQAEWHQNGVDLEVEVVTPTKVLVWYSDPHEEWEDEFDFDFTRLVKAVKRLGRA